MPDDPDPERPTPATSVLRGGEGEEAHFAETDFEKPL
jgi:hypothetical protein